MPRPHPPAATRGRTNGRVAIVVPTYDEVENLRPLVDGVLHALPEAHVLVVDDASPDGTGELADALAAREPRVQVLHRPGREGLGAAYLAGFAIALGGDRAADVIVEMDADGSHPADALPTMIDRLADAEDPVGLVIGSRWVRGGRIRDWPLHRSLLSRAGNLYTRVLLGIPVRDATAGFRAYRAAVLRDAIREPVDSHGYCFQIDLARRVHAAGHGIAEVPITFRERRHGASKMSGRIVLEAMLRVTGWGLQRLFRTSRRPRRRVG